MPRFRSIAQIRQLHTLEIRPIRKPLEPLEVLGVLETFKWQDMAGSLSEGFLSKNGPWRSAGCSHSTKHHHYEPLILSMNHY